MVHSAGACGQGGRAVLECSGIAMSVKVGQKGGATRACVKLVCLVYVGCLAKFFGAPRPFHPQSLASWIAYLCFFPYTQGRDGQGETHRGNCFLLLLLVL